jgi:hypothetical protein
MTSQTQTVEEWRTIPGYVGLYEVSDLGRVRSVARKCKTWFGERSHRQQILKPCQNWAGYFCVNLRSNDKTRRTVSVHRLVLLAFVGPRPEGLQGCHNDGVKANNRLDNLRYDTREANYRDRDRHGNQPRGAAVKTAKLTTQAVLEIREHRRAGVDRRTLAKRNSVSTKHIDSIVAGRRWGWL